MSYCQIKSIHLKIPSGSEKPLHSALSTMTVVSEKLFILKLPCNYSDELILKSSKVQNLPFLW